MSRIIFLSLHMFFSTKLTHLLLTKDKVGVEHPLHLIVHTKEHSLPNPFYWRSLLDSF